MGSKRKKGIWACEDLAQGKSLSVLTGECQYRRGVFLKDSGCPTPPPYLGGPTNGKSECHMTSEQGEQRLSVVRL